MEDYERLIIRLYNQKHPIKGIAKKIGVSYTKIRNILIRNKTEIRPAGRKKSIKETANILTEKKAYVLGVVGPGDGFIEFNKRSQQVCLEAVDKDFIDFFAKCLENVYGIRPSVKLLKIRDGDKQRHFKVRLYSVEACRDLVSYGVSLREKDWRVPKEMMEASQKVKSMYVLGMADSQGSVNFGKSTRFIELSSKNKRGLMEIGELLDDLGIVDWSLSGNGLRITSRLSMSKFAKKINFRIGRKSLILRDMLKSYKRYGMTKRETKNLRFKIANLRNSGLKPDQIAKKLQIHWSTVYRHLKNDRMFYITSKGE